MSDPFFDLDYDNMSTSELLNTLGQTEAAVEQWNEQNPDPQR